jgi:hypothetical protein
VNSRRDPGFRGADGGWRQEFVRQMSEAMMARRSIGRPSPRSRHPHARVAARRNTTRDGIDSRLRSYNPIVSRTAPHGWRPERPRARSRGRTAKLMPLSTLPPSSYPRHGRRFARGIRAPQRAPASLLGSGHRPVPKGTPRRRRGPLDGARAAPEKGPFKAWKHAQSALKYKGFFANREFGLEARESRLR